VRHVTVIECGKLLAMESNAVPYYNNKLDLRQTYQLYLIL